jgi:PAS domain S-box-containing protein
MRRRTPSLITIILLPPLVGLLVLIAGGWFMIYDKISSSIVTAEQARLSQDGWPRALEISRRTSSTGELDLDFLDRIAFRAGFEQVLIVDAGGLISFANDVLLKSRHISDLTSIPQSIQDAIKSRGCNDGLVQPSGKSHLVGCWPVSLSRATNQLSTSQTGYLIATSRMQDKISGVQSELQFHALQVLGIGMLLIGLLLYILHRFVLRPIFEVTQRILSPDSGPTQEFVPEGGTIEIDGISTALETAFSNLRHREAQIEAILNTTVDGIITIDTRGTIIQANAAVEGMFGYSPDEIVGQNVTMLMADIDTARHTSSIHAFDQSGRTRSNLGREVVAARRNGSTFLVQINVARITLRGQSFFTASVRDVTADKLFEFRLHEIAHTDPHLKIANRLSWETSLSALVGPASTGTDFSVLIVTIRNLDVLIVTFGTSIEAGLLKAVHGAVSELFSLRDISARITRSRLGFVLPSGSDTSPDAVANRFLPLVRKAFRVDQTSVVPDILAVIVPHAERYQSGSDLLKAIEAAGSWATQVFDRRASPVLVYDEAVAASISNRTRISAELPEAIHSGLIYPVYQPKIVLRTGGLCGVEGLARWKRADGTFVSPADFIPIAEKLGLIGHLDNTLAATMLSGLSEGRLGIPADSVVSINASARELDDPNWVCGLSALANRFGILPKRIEVEVTESAVLDDVDKAADVLNLLRQAGFRVAIDDFGTGYASLTYLKKLPADIVKIDQSFIRDMTKSKPSEVIVRSMVSLSHDLGMEVIAEGVEDAETASMLFAIGCDFGQGWHFGRPMESGALAAFSAGLSIR